MLSQLGVQGAFNQQFGQMLEQSIVANEVFRLFVVGQQAREQFFGNVVFLDVHSAYGQASLRWRWIGRLHKILHTLVVGDLLSQVSHLDKRVEQYDQHIAQIAKEDSRTEQLMRLPGVGPTTATANWP